MKYALALVLLVGCAQGVPVKSAEDVAKEVQATADKLEQALDKAQELTSPVIAGIDTACAVAAPDSVACQKANEIITRFELALDRAQDAIDQYRAFTGTFADATRALALAIQAGADVAKAAVP